MKFLVPTVVFLSCFNGLLAYTPDYIQSGLTGSGTTTRYWDCCKPSCAWIDNVPAVGQSVASCGSDGNSVISPETMSSCIGGTAYMCTNQQAFTENSTFAYGFAAASFTGGADLNKCCSCFLLTFQGGLSGKQMVIQVTNTGGDLGANQFDIAIPGGGVGIFTDGCSSQWGVPGNGWGDQYGGVHNSGECSQLPSDYQSGCNFRFDFMNDVSNPPVQFAEVVCPSEVTSKSGCQV